MDAVRIWTLGEADLESAADVLTAAFMDDPFYSYAIPDRTTRALHLPPFFIACLRYGVRYGQVIAAGRTEGQVDGVAFSYLYPEWHFNHERTSAVGFDEVDQLLGEGSKRITALSGEVDEHAGPLLPEPRVHLDLIGVNPDEQGHGIGAALLQTVIDHATAENLPVALWTETERAKTFYEGRGFAVVAQGTYLNAGAEWWSLLRLPG